MFSQQIKLTFFVISLFLIQTGFADELKFHTPLLKNQDQNKTGFYTRIIGSHDGNLYVESLQIDGRKESKFVKISIINKEDFKEVKTVEIYNQNEKDGKNLYISSYGGFQDGKLLIFYHERKSKDMKTLWARTFDENLNPLTGYQPVYQIPNTKEFKNVDWLLKSNDSRTKYFVGAEFPAKKGESPMVDYVVISDKLEKIHTGKFELPVTITSKRSSTSDAGYSLTESGDLLITTYVNIPKEDQKSLQKGEAKGYMLVSTLDPSTSSLNTAPVKFAGKNVFNTRFVLTKDQIRLIGFYSELDDDPTGSMVSGIYSANFDRASLKISDAKFTRFTKEDVLRLTEFNTSTKKGEKAAAKMTEADANLPSTLYIENFRVDDQGNVFLFCNPYYNYSQTVCSGSGSNRSCYTQRYCYKGRIYIFKLNKESELVFSESRNRSYTYGGYYVMDQEVMESNNKFFITYRTSISHDPLEQTDKRMKKIDVAKGEKLEYLVFDPAQGNVETRYLYYNSPDQKKSTRFRLEPEEFYAMKDGFYGIQTDYYTPTGTKVMNTVITIATLPIGGFGLIYYLFIRPSVNKGALKSESYITKVAPM